MTPRRTVLRWSPEGPQRPPVDPRSLEQRLSSSARDRTGAADEVVRDAARELLGWLRSAHASPGAAPDPDPGPDLPAAFRQALREGLLPWSRSQIWRAPCARFLARIEAALEGRPDALLALLALLEREARAAAPERRSLVPHALRGLERRERVLVRGASLTVGLVLEEAWRAGLEPEVLLGEGRPDLSGKRMARRLARHGLRVSVTYDAALPELVAGVDRIWLGSEALGGGAFVGRVGDLALFGAAREEGVPVELLAGRDKLHPAGLPPLPAWDREEPYALWGDAPEGVLPEAAFLRHVELERLDAWIHEHGRAADPARDPDLGAAPAASPWAPRPVRLPS